MSDHGDKGKPSSESRETTDDEKSAARKTTPIIKTPQSVAINPETENPKWNDEERSYYRGYLRTQRALVFITIGGIAVALCTLRSLNESVTAANEQAKAAGTQAVAAATQAQTAQKEFQSSQRARMVLGDRQGSIMEFSESSEKDASVVVHLQNQGHTPAHEVVIEIWPLMAPPETTLHYDALSPKGRFMSGPTIGEGQPYDPTSGSQRPPEMLKPESRMTERHPAPFASPEKGGNSVTGDRIMLQSRCRGQPEARGNLILRRAAEILVAGRSFRRPETPRFTTTGCWSGVDSKRRCREKVKPV